MARKALALQHLDLEDGAGLALPQKRREAGYRNTQPN